MTVRWMTPNSSSGAGVAGDAVLRGRECGRGTGRGGRVTGSGLVMLSSLGREAREADSAWVGSSGRGSGWESKPGMCKHSWRPQGGGTCPGGQMEGEGARPGEQANLRGG